MIILSSCGGMRSDVVLDVHKDIKSLSLRGNELYFNGRYKDAAKFYGKALRLARGIDDRSGEAEALNNLGELYMVAKDYKSALGDFEKSVAIYESIDDAKGRAAVMNNMGRAHLEIGDTAYARDEFKKSISLYGKSADKFGEAFAMNNLGRLEISLGEYENGLLHVHSALNTALRRRRHRFAAACYRNLARAAELNGNLNASVFDLRRALNEDKLVEYAPGIGNDLFLLGTVLSSKGEKHSAKIVFERALNVYSRLGFKSYVKKCESAISTLTK